MLTLLLILLLIPPVLFLPGRIPALIVCRRTSLGAEAGAFLTVIFSMALFPLILYNIGHFFNLKPVSLMRDGIVVLLLVSLIFLAVFYIYNSSGKIAGPDENTAKELFSRGNWRYILPFTAFIAVICYIPFFQYGVVDGGKIKFTWIFDWYIDLGIVDSISLFGLPIENIFIHTAKPLSYHSFSMILKSIPVVLSNNALDPALVSNIFNIIICVAFVAAVMFLFRKFSSTKAVVFALLFLLLFSGVDFLVYVLSSGDLLLKGIPYLTDSWADITDLRIMTPYAYFLWQPRHIPAIIFFVVVVFLLYSRKESPLLFGVFSGILIASAIGYSLPNAVNGSAVLSFLFIMSLYSDYRRGQTRNSIRFICPAVLVSLILSIPFIEDFLRSGQGASLFVSLPSVQTVLGMFFVDYMPLIVFGAAGLYLYAIRKNRIPFDHYMSVTIGVSLLLMLTLRRNLGGILSNNDFGMKTSMFVWIGLSYFAARYFDFRKTNFHNTGVFTRRGCRYALYLLFFIVLLVFYNLFVMSYYILICYVLTVIIIEVVISRHVLFISRWFPLLTIVLFLSFSNTVYNIVGHYNTDMVLDINKYNAFNWVRHNTETDSCVQVLPLRQGTGLVVTSCTGRRTYVDAQGYIFSKQKTYREKVEDMKDLFSSLDIPTIHKKLTGYGIDYLILPVHPMVRKMGSSGLFETVYENRGFEVLRVKKRVGSGRKRL